MEVKKAILRKIDEKKRKSIDPNTISSISLSIDVYNLLCSQLTPKDDIYYVSYRGGSSIFGLPIKVSYKRRNTIIINTRRHYRPYRYYIPIESWR